MKQKADQALPATPDAASGAQGARAANWRVLMHDHAAQVWRNAIRLAAEGKTASEALNEDSAALATSTAAVPGETIEIVEAFTLGAAAQAQTQAGGGNAEPPSEFFARLDLILDGFDRRQADENEAEEFRKEDLAPKIFQSELWQVLHKVRESGELSYARELDLVELDRRIVFLIRSRGPLVPAGLSSAIGVDKAQVSRSVKRLLERQLVERSQIRAPVSLTAKGEGLADRLVRLASMRNRELTFDVDDEELSEFFSVMEILIVRAMMLYDQEREEAHLQGRSEAELAGVNYYQPQSSGEPIPIDRSRVVSPLLTLSSYFMRSAALAYKRLTGLSNFEAWVLTEVSKDPPIEWPQLVATLERDHSQAGRTVRTLMERDLISREGRPSRRHGRFSPTEEGQRLFEIIRNTSRRRSAFLMAPLPPEKLKSFLGTFDKIRRNTVAQLERERAFEEFEPG